MRKKVLGLVMAALAISTVGAFAQNQTQSNCPQTVSCEKNKGCDKKDGKKHEKRAHVNPFDGLNLTPEQQTQIDQLRAERKQKKEAAGKADKEAKEARKAAKAQERKAYEESLQKILTPEQFSQYQANCNSVKSKLKSQKREGMKKAKKDGNFAKAKKDAKVNK